MDLVPYMYWERQEAGSMLCAQHCLNNLLQQHTYSEFDLADLARNLDQAENALRNPGSNKKSYNYDDTGFFSITVLEKALQVWDLTLVRWRGEAMKPYQEKPEDQAAFILHLSSHWFPLRRFGGKQKRWYNLNSFLPNGPEWISPTYLRLVLAQAEKEGYSVFVIRKAGEIPVEGKGWADGGVGKMLDSVADAMAKQLGDPAGRTGAGANVGAGAASLKSGFGNVDQPEAGPSRDHDQPTVDTSAPSATVWADNDAQGEASGSSRRRRRQEDLPSSDDITNDPFMPTSTAGRPPRSSVRPSPAVAPRGQGESDIFADSRDPAGMDIEDDNDIYEDADEDIPDDLQTTHGRRALQELEGHDGPMDFAHHSRSYDDEDAALQAALKASMEDLPEGWVAPTFAEPKIQKTPGERQTAAATQSARPSQVAPPKPAAPPQPPKQEKKEELEEDDDDEPAESLTADPQTPSGEVRRKRLALASRGRGRGEGKRKLE